MIDFGTRSKPVAHCGRAAFEHVQSGNSLREDRFQQDIQKRTCESVEQKGNLCHLPAVPWTSAVPDLGASQRSAKLGICGGPSSVPNISSKLLAKMANVPHRTGFAQSGSMASHSEKVAALRDATGEACERPPSQQYAEVLWSL